jgi:hypothetical protein
LHDEELVDGVGGYLGRTGPPEPMTG